MLSKPLIITVLLSALILTTASCENQRQRDDKELIRIDAAPHANLVNQAKEDWSWIAGTDWTLTSIEGQTPIKNSNLWIRFENHTWLNGSSGCNQLTANYTRKGIDGLQITQTASTKMHCPQPGIMQQESRYLHLLANIDSYHAEPNTLTLSTNAITTLTFKRANPENETP